MPGLSRSNPGYLDELGTNWQEAPALTGLAQATFAPRSELERLKARRAVAALTAGRRRPITRQAAFRLRDDCFVSRAAILMRLLASTAAATHNSQRSCPSARHRFMPRPRNSTEMRPSMPARKRWPYSMGVRIAAMDLFVVPSIGFDLLYGLA